MQVNKLEKMLEEDHRKISIEIRKIRNKAKRMPLYKLDESDILYDKAYKLEGNIEYIEKIQKFIIENKEETKNG